MEQNTFFNHSFTSKHFLCVQRSPCMVKNTLFYLYTNFEIPLFYFCLHCRDSCLFQASTKIPLNVFFQLQCYHN